MPVAIHRAGFERFAGRHFAARDDMRFGLRLDLCNFTLADDDQLARLGVVRDIRRRRQTLEQPGGGVGFQVYLAERAAILGVGAEIIGAAVRFDRDMANLFAVARKRAADFG
jgi:hypothetical protein